MCVSQFRDYCKASEFKHSNYEDDSKDKNLIVRKETKWYNGRCYYYATDLRELRKLALQNNVYAKQQLK